MCDDSGIYADGGEVVVDPGGILGEFAVDDLDEQTKREILINGLGPSIKSPDPRCRWCGGTGKVKLLVSETECDCVR